jgi:hypothetical protein
MLKQAETDEIASVLTAVLALNGRPWFSGFFQGPAFPTALNELAGPMASDQQVARAAIQVCLDREWSDKSSWLQVLLEGLDASTGRAGRR